MNFKDFIGQMEKLSKKWGWPLLGEIFEGHPEDPTILGEIYMWDSPTPEQISDIREINPYRGSLIIDSNVITIYK